MVGLLRLGRGRSVGGHEREWEDRGNGRRPMRIKVEGVIGTDRFE